MSITYGFYNSLNGDRRYTAEQISRIFSGVISDGVFMSIGEQLRVSASDKMTVIVGSGRAWFNGTWTDNDSSYYVTIPTSEMTTNRIDAVVLEVDSNENVRANSIKVVSGTPATNPSKPTLANSANVRQYPLAYITVRANTADIKQSDITNAVGTSECPWITGILQTIDTDELITQWVDQFNEIYARLETAISQTLAAEIVDSSITTEKIVNDAVTADKINPEGVLEKIGAADAASAIAKLNTSVIPTRTNTMSFAIKSVRESASNAWRRQMVTVQAWSQGGDFANIQMLIDLIDGSPYGGTPAFVAVGRNLPVESILYSTTGQETTYTIKFKASSMWALGYVTYRDGEGMTVVEAEDIAAGTYLTVDAFSTIPTNIVVKRYNLSTSAAFTDALNDLWNNTPDDGERHVIFNVIAGNAPLPGGVWTVIAYKINADYGVVQAIGYNGSAPSVLYIRKATAWGAWEWENPPMANGVEYRTTERFQNYAVYAKSLDIGGISKGNNVIAHNTSIYHPLSLDVMNNDRELLNNSSLFTDISLDRTNLNLFCTSNFGYIRAIIKYTRSA